MSRNSRDRIARKALAAKMSLQCDLSLSEAAESLEPFAAGWDDSGDAAAGVIGGHPGPAARRTAEVT